MREIPRDRCRQPAWNDAGARTLPPSYFTSSFILYFLLHIFTSSFILYFLLHTLLPPSYFTSSFILYFLLHTLLPPSYFTSSFILYFLLHTSSFLLHTSDSDLGDVFTHVGNALVMVNAENKVRSVVHQKELTMWYRLLSVLVLLTTLCLATPSYAADDDDAADDLSLLPPAPWRATITNKSHLAFFRHKHPPTSQPSHPPLSACAPKKSPRSD
jgi:hypothetical protein